MPASATLGAVGELAASRHGVLTRRQAADNELGPMAVSRLIARGVLDEPAPGVLRVRGAPVTFHQRALIATLAGGGHGLLIGGPAARLHDVDGFDTDPGILIAIRRGGKVRLPGVATTQTREWYDDDLDVITIDGIRCSTIARSVADLARYHPARHERAADDFQRRGYSLAWMEQTLDRIPRRRGDGLDRAYADLARRRNGGRVRESWFEQLVELCVNSPRIPRVARQFEVTDSAGEVLGRADLAIPSLRLAIEAHSRRFHTGPAVEAFDQQRDNSFAVVGWDTAYVGWYEATRTPADVCRVVERIAARRATDLGLDLAALCRRQPEHRALPEPSSGRRTSRLP